MISIATRQPFANFETRLMAEMAARVETWFGPGASLRLGPRRSKFRHSFMFEYQVQTAQGIRSILVKIARKPGLERVEAVVAIETLREIARQEYEQLELIWNAFQDDSTPGFYAVQPLAYLSEWNAIVMLKVSGRSFDQFFYLASWLPSRRPVFEGLLRQAGAWLQIFHRLVGARELEFFPQAVARELASAMLASLTKNSAGQVATAEMQAGLDRLLDQVHTPLLVARPHGDFHYSNLLYTPEGAVCALDAYVESREPVYADLAILIVHPQTRLLQVLTNGYFLGPEPLARFQKAVLDGYFQKNEFNLSALYFYCAIQLLHQWSMNEKRLARTGLAGSLFRPLVRQMRCYFRRVLETYL